MSYDVWLFAPTYACISTKLSLYLVNKAFSHTFLIDNHVRLHSSQNASNTGNVYDKHLRLTTKPHLGVISGTFHTKSALTCGYAPPTIY